MAGEPENKDFHFIQEFDKAMQATNHDLSIEMRRSNMLTAMAAMRKLVMDMFDTNAYLSKEESLAYAQDCVANNSKVRYDNLVRVWYTFWEISQLPAPLGGKKR